MIHAVVDDDELEARTDALASELGAAATTAIGLTKWLLVETADGDYADGLRAESLVEDISTISRAELNTASRRS